MEWDSCSYDPGEGLCGELKGQDTNGPFHTFSKESQSNRDWLDLRDGPGKASPDVRCELPTKHLALPTEHLAPSTFNLVPRSLRPSTSQWSGTHLPTTTAKSHKEAQREERTDAETVPVFTVTAAAPSELPESST